MDVLALGLEGFGRGGKGRDDTGGMSMTVNALRGPIVGWSTSGTGFSFSC